MDIMTAAMDPTTDAHPFMAHSQGIISCLLLFTLSRARGKGMPMTNPRGSTSRAEKINLCHRGLEIMKSPIYEKPNINTRI